MKMETSTKHIPANRSPIICANPVQALPHPYTSLKYKAKVFHSHVYRKALMPTDTMANDTGATEHR